MSLLIIALLFFWCESEPKDKLLAVLEAAPIEDEPLSRRELEALAEPDEDDAAAVSLEEYRAQRAALRAG